MNVKRRTTVRKAIIEKVLAEEYQGGPVLLEELRWKVLAVEYGSSFVEMTDAKMKSFARTIRKHYPHLICRRISIKEAPSGMVARAACYRIRSREILERFLAVKNKYTFTTVCFRDDDHGRSELRQRTTVGCYFSDRFPDRHMVGSVKKLALAEVVVPITHRFNIVQNADVPLDQSLNVVADVPWRLFFFYRTRGKVWDLNAWTSMDESGELTRFAALPFHEIGFK